MTISSWLMILALAVGTGTSQSILSDTSTSARGTEEPVGPCWINGVWYNPCPHGNGMPWDPEPPPPEEPPD